MRKLLQLPIAVALGLCLAGGAEAELLNWKGTLTLEFVQGVPSVSFGGGGVATVNGSGGLGALNSLRLAGGITGSMATIWVTDPDIAGFNGFRPTVALGTGVLGPISGGATPSPLTQNTLPLGGDLRVCAILLECISYLPVPLTVGGTRGAGIGGGLITVNGYGPVKLKVSVTGAPWTIGTAVAFNGTTANGLPTSTAVRSGFAHGPASGTTSTANLGGVVQLVTPIQLRVTYFSSPWLQLGLFAELKITFVPEPSTALLLGAGVAGLALMGRGAKRHKPS